MGVTPAELDAFFAGRPASRGLFEAVRAAVDDTVRAWIAEAWALAG